MKTGQKELNHLIRGKHHIQLAHDAFAKSVKPGESSRLLDNLKLLKNATKDICDSLQQIVDKG